jgi:hypothetical protein
MTRIELNRWHGRRGGRTEDTASIREPGPLPSGILRRAGRPDFESVARQRRR